MRAADESASTRMTEEEHVERYRQSVEALEELEAGGLTAAGDEVLAWIASWGTDDEKPVPRLQRR